MKLAVLPIDDHGRLGYRLLRSRAPHAYLPRVRGAVDVRHHRVLGPKSAGAHLLALPRARRPRRARADHAGGRAMSPWAPARPCSTCGRLGCLAHLRRGRWDGRQSRQARNYGGAWDRLRHLALERDGYACRLCGGTERLSVDHRVPRSRGGADTLDNLQTLDGRCHDAKTAREGREAQRMTPRKGRAMQSLRIERGAVPVLSAGSTDSPTAYGARRA
jgi:5-methylcytosine-specific restriction protein A